MRSLPRSFLLILIILVLLLGAAGNIVRAQPPSPSPTHPKIDQTNGAQRQPSADDKATQALATVISQYIAAGT